ncbi:hypothetical protein [Cellulomonas soli]|uniref:Uncharacterized protein n=1 Tax=Cellulomonas soli TaxID=931535 RepID=A0A512PAX6_9CELL|nr:hypothetical protein [Cellulomonas soli]NYI57394.1 hypothetical protein [Cellulomonas soli]GEP68326.1 hypothetical protein CSO01_10410 [Cellulomonas soli]
MTTTPTAGTPGGTADDARATAPLPATPPTDPDAPDLEATEQIAPVETVDPTTVTQPPASAPGIAAPAPATTDPLLALAAAAGTATDEGTATGASGPSTGFLARIRASLATHPVITGAVAVVLAAGAGFGGGYAVGHAGGGDQGQFTPGEDGWGDRPGMPEDGTRPDDRTGQGGTDTAPDSGSGTDSGTDSGSASGSDT